MAEVTLYTTRYCPFCTAARALLEDRGIAFTERDVTGSPEERQGLIERTGGRTTVPQIFIDGRSIGGYDELVALDRSGRLAELLA